MTDRAERLERIRELLEDRRHPERRVGLFSPTNLTRVFVRFAGMGLAVAVVHALLGGTLLEVPVAAVAVGAVDQFTSRLWKRIRGAVQQGWTVVAIVLVLCMTIGLVIQSLAPTSGLARGAKGMFTGWLESQRAAMDRKARGRRIPVDSAAAVSDAWRLLTDSGAVRLGTYAQAKGWCAELGPGWQLPPGLGEWPELPSYPNVGTTFYVWTWAGVGLQIGDGQKPAVSVSSGHRDTEVRGVLCMKGGS